MCANECEVKERKETIDASRRKVHSQSNADSCSWTPFWLIGRTRNSKKVQQQSSASIFEKPTKNFNSSTMEFDMCASGFLLFSIMTCIARATPTPVNQIVNLENKDKSLTTGQVAAVRVQTQCIQIFYSASNHNSRSVTKSR